MKMGAEKFDQYYDAFGFRDLTGIDLPGEARTDTLIYSKEDLGRTINIATNSFGQNFNVTMIQLASAFASLVNGGNLYKPHVVKSIVDPSGNVIKTYGTEIEKKTVSLEVSEEMKSMLRAVVEEGTGGIAGVLGYDIGGKTGTAQKLPRSDGKHLVSFIGYAPQEDPKVLIYVVVDEPNDPDQAHSVFAQEIAHNIMVQILPYLNIEKADPTLFDEKTEYTSMFTKIDTEGTVSGAGHDSEGEATTEDTGNNVEPETQPTEGA